MANGDTVGAEALLRIGHPSRGTIDAAEFIDVAEDIGITVDLGDWILHEACRQLAAWRDLTGADLQVSVNVSGRQAAQANIADLVASATAAAGISPGRLSLEFTETILLEAGHSMRHDLHTLAGKGVHLVLDDFGTGYTSLTHVKQFPVDGVKIDRSLVSGVANERESRAVVAAIVTLCRGLGITATAVGVETAQQLAALREMAPRAGLPHRASPATERVAPLAHPAQRASDALGVWVIELGFHPPGERLQRVAQARPGNRPQPQQEAQLTDEPEGKQQPFAPDEP
ncbi:MAG: EAL domain-containing protein [Frankiaceae bacterium]